MIKNTDRLECIVLLENDLTTSKEIEEMCTKRGYIIKQYDTVLGAIIDIINNKIKPIGYLVDASYLKGPIHNQRFYKFLRYSGFNPKFFSIFYGIKNQ